MKINDKVKLDLIIKHNMEMKWMQDEIAKIESQNAIDNAIAKEMKDSEPKFQGGPLKFRRDKRDAVLKEIRAKYEGGA